ILNPEHPFYLSRLRAPGPEHRSPARPPPPPSQEPPDWDFKPTLPAVWPQAPPGFVVDKYVTGLDRPRVIRRAPNGDIFIAESAAGRIRILRERGGDEPLIETYAADLPLPYGIAFFPLGGDPEFVYIGNTNSVVRFPYRNGDLTLRGPMEVVVPALPEAGHWTRDIAFSLDGRTLYIAVGSGSNVTDTDSNPGEANRAAILETSPDGGTLHVFASGLRNPSGLGVDARTGDLWTTVNERDLIGNNLPSDYVTTVRRTGFYACPCFYIAPPSAPP